MLPVLLLSACSGQSEDLRGEPIACALEGRTDFADHCRLQRQGTEMLVVRPNGGFHRLGEVGGRLVAIDGAEQPRVTRIASGMVEVAIGSDRYRFRPTGVIR